MRKNMINNINFVLKGDRSGDRKSVKCGMKW